LRKLRDVALDGAEGGVVVLVARELEQPLRVAQAARDAGEAADDGVELLLLLAELLGALGIVPDLRVLELFR
jgi:hypothetical protein